MLEDNEYQVKESEQSWFNSLRWRIIGIVVFLVAITGWMVFAGEAEGILGHADEIGYAVCHQIDLRSFHIGDRPLPLCARCSGM